MPNQYEGSRLLSALDYEPQTDFTANAVEGVGELLGEREPVRPQLSLVTGFDEMFENIEAAEDSMWEAGDKVAHPKFGPGVIVTAQKNGSDIEYVVEFQSAGTRRLLQSYAKLVPA